MSLFDFVLPPLATLFFVPLLGGCNPLPNVIEFYGLADATEARAYLDHPVLGERLRTCTRAILRPSNTTSAFDILGSPDDLKFRSCMTLFSVIAPDEKLWRQALDAFYGGESDRLTLKLLIQTPGA